MNRVDLIVPTFNGTDYLVACLETLRDSTFTDFNLIIVDDGSDEPVEPQVRRIFPAATVLRWEQNQGLTYAFNQAIDATSSELVVLLNNDTEVEPTWLEELVACADRHPEAGSIASKLRLASDRRVIHSAGDTFSVRGMPGNRGVWLDDFGQYDSEEDVFSACGGAVLYRRTALDIVRLPNGDVFDRRLFMYCEDVDLGWRLQLAGLRCIFAPRAVVYHHLSATGGGALASYYVNRNVWFLMARTIPTPLLRPHRDRIVAFHLGRTVRALRRIREPSARRQLAGTIAGVTAYLKHRERPAYSHPVNLNRVQQLLVDR